MNLETCKFRANFRTNGTSGSGNVIVIIVHIPFVSLKLEEGSKIGETVGLITFMNVLGVKVFSKVENVEVVL